MALYAIILPNPALIMSTGVLALLRGAVDLYEFNQYLAERRKSHPSELESTSVKTAIEFFNRKKEIIYQEYLETHSNLDFKI